jgi:hypothetical protein
MGYEDEESRLIRERMMRDPLFFVQGLPGGPTFPGMRGPVGQNAGSTTGSMSGWVDMSIPPGHQGPAPNVIVMERGQDGTFSASGERGVPSQQGIVRGFSGKVTTDGEVVVDVKEATVHLKTEVWDE